MESRQGSNSYLVVVPRIVNKVGEWYQFPLGIAYISASLKKAGYSVSTLNLNHVEGAVSNIIREAIKRDDIDTVMTGGLTGQYGAIKDVLSSAKATNENITTIVGGGIVTSAPEAAMQALQYADYGVIGEGEIIVCALCNAIQNGLSVRDVAGIVYKDGDAYLRTIGCVETVDIETLPIPDYEGLGFSELMDSVPNILGMCEQNTMPIITSRSCPFSCTFCFHPSGQKYRKRSMDSVFREIDYLVDRFGVKYLSIQDELFSIKFSRVKEFCERIKSYGIKWLANFRVCDVTPEMVEVLKEGNCAVMAFGVESADNDILRSMQKKITIEQTECALDLVYKSGMGIQGVLIFGDPEETVETAKRSFDWWKRHVDYGLHLSAIITYPGTKLYEYAIQKGLITDPVQYIKDGCPIVRLSAMTDDEYAWMFGQLLSLPRQTFASPLAQEITNIDYQKASIALSGTCSSCGHHNQWEQVRLFMQETLSCTECGKRHIAPIPEEVVSRVSGGLRKLQDTYHEIAIWGINSYFYSFAERLKLKGGDGVYLVDKSESRQNVNVHGKRVQLPEIINEKNIRCVVVSVVNYYSVLEGVIRVEHPCVDKVISISELLE